MFDKKSDFSLNKANPDMIVCPSVTGIHTLLAREDFSCEEEFLYWKQLSDNDYKNTEKSGRSFYDHCISLNEAQKSADTSVEDVFVVPILEADQKEQQIVMVQKIKNLLTEAQYRRLWLHLVDGLSVEQIAQQEGITHQTASECLMRAKEIIINNL